HQCGKNTLVFVPLLTSHRYFQLDATLNALIAFITFFLLTCSVYLINDLIDIEVDRAHCTKSKRPFAAGDLSGKIGIAWIVVFIFAAGWLALHQNPQFQWMLVCYFSMAMLY